jgi:hypothetical protein
MVQAWLRAEEVVLAREKSEQHTVCRPDQQELRISSVDSLMVRCGATRRGVSIVPNTNVGR